MDAIVDVASSDSEFNQVFVIQQNEQDSRKGVFWMATGSCFTVISAASTVGTVSLIGLTALLGLGGMDAFNAFSSKLPVSLSEMLPTSLGRMFAISATAGIADYLAIRITGYCFSNALYHFGPEFEIVRK